MIDLIKELIRSQDRFQQFVGLNYKPKEKSYRTITGGVSYFLISLLLIVFTGFNIQKMILYQQSVFATTTTQINPATLG
jgi:hypothetical protein